MTHSEVSKEIVTNGKAIVSLVLGICSIALVSSMGFVLAIVGLFLGIICLVEIKHLDQEGR
ncbi:DUF4190 domain-containing protein [Virgibacillus halophilus]|uniref:DUF4190 domain-containing protein n=1 Tax=Tigheibacillus halophilus TaxID=361280 RepID=A0ABU5C3N3_9BACI|nr:DUF4190 domain-containing protein [Virgibacillus halophilus]